MKPGEKELKPALSLVSESHSVAGFRIGESFPFYQGRSRDSLI